MKKNLLFTIAAAILLLSSCQKEPGLGGNSAIHGLVELKNYNQNFTILKEQKPLIDDYVYIVYGNNAGTSDRVKTSYDGSFSFTHLTKGKYTVYAFSKDTTLNTTGEIAVIKEVEITADKQDVDAGTIVVANNNAIGNATIFGKVLMQSSTTGNSYYESNQYVYIIYDNGISYETSIRTNYNGEYLFSNLPLGTYTIYTYSLDIFNTSPNNVIHVIQTVTINSINQIVVLPDLVIYY